LADEGTLGDGQLRLTGELAFRFCTYWTIVATRRTQKPDVRYPFHHLSTDGFWTCLDGEGRPSVDRRLTRLSLLDPDFVASLRDPDFRERARRLLITTYFPLGEQLSLYTMMGLLPPEQSEVAPEPGFDRGDAIEKGRSAIFRLSIVAAYNYTCALTQLRLLTIDSGSIVDAAHIHQFARSRNDNPRNGLALCKNAHWLFDNGLWSLSDDYRVIVARDDFTETCPDQTPLLDYEGRQILLPGNPKLWPDPVHLAWHRKHVFSGTA
jgi:putative restriction endonuclease